MLDELVPASERRAFTFDANLKRDFSDTKLKIVKEKAVELVGELPANKKAIELYFQRVFRFKVGDGFSVGLGVHGKKKEVSLIISFTGNMPVYRVSAISDPDFADGRVE